jgi:hypothetical protein
MARRRMMSLDIVDTDKFLAMPTSSQCLYFHLLARGDDDGFIDSPKKILKIVGCSEDDFKILMMKFYVIPFETGVCVVKDWKIHNYIQKDRYKQTLYINEKSQLAEDKNGAYVLNSLDTKCIQDVSSLDTQVSLGKDRLELGKVSSEKETSSSITIKKDDDVFFNKFISEISPVKKYPFDFDSDQHLWKNLLEIQPNAEILIGIIKLWVINVLGEDPLINPRIRLHGWVQKCCEDEIIARKKEQA